MYHSCHVCDKGFDVLLGFISILHCMFAVRVLMYHSSHVCDKGFYVHLESQVYLLACLLSGLSCTASIMFVTPLEGCLVCHWRHKHNVFHVCYKGCHAPLYFYV